ncbi:hypothetical protein RFI_29569, partial [Reticulomyxa filosa]
MNSDMKIENENVSIFETLTSFHIPLQKTQCVTHKDEIIICGGEFKRNCYSYHTIKNDYKYICFYPGGIDLDGHCVVKIASNDKDTNKDEHEIILLSFGGYYKHTLIMKYASVWNNDDVRKKLSLNQWFPLTDHNKNPISLGRKNDNYEGVRAVIGGSNNHLLFITYFPSDICVFDLTKLQYIKYDTLPIDCITYHCLVFIPKCESEINKSSKDREKSKNKENNRMLLFSRDIGLSIQYNENNNLFQFDKMRICNTLRPLYRCAYTIIDNNCILFFGGNSQYGPSDNMHKYIITENKWMKYQQILPSLSRDCIAVLNGDKTSVHIIGLFNNNIKELTHLKTNACEYMKEDNRQWVEEDKEIVWIEEVNADLKEVKHELDIKKLKKKRHIEMIIDHWIDVSAVKKKGWIDDFNIIILRYALLKYFKPSKVFQKYSNCVNSVRFSLDGTKVISSSNYEIKIWDIKSGNKIQELNGHPDYIKDAQFSPDGTIIMSYSNNRVIRLWDAKLGIEIKRLLGHEDIVKSAKFSPDGTSIISGSRDGTIILWNVKSGQEIQRLEGLLNSIDHLCFSPNGQQIVVTSNRVTIWDLKLWERIHEFVDLDYVKDAKFSPDGLYVIFYLRNGLIHIHNVLTGKQLNKFHRYFGKINN